MGVQTSYNYGSAALRYPPPALRSLLRRPSAPRRNPGGQDEDVKMDAEDVISGVRERKDRRDSDGEQMDAEEVIAEQEGDILNIFLLLYPYGQCSALPALLPVQLQQEQDGSLRYPAVWHRISVHRVRRVSRPESDRNQAITHAGHTP